MDGPWEKSHIRTWGVLAPVSSDFLRPPPLIDSAVPFNIPTRTFSSRPARRAAFSLRFPENSYAARRYQRRVLLSTADNCRLYILYPICRIYILLLNIIIYTYLSCIGTYFYAVFTVSFVAFSVTFPIYSRNSFFSNILIYGREIPYGFSLFRPLFRYFCDFSLSEIFLALFLLKYPHIYGRKIPYAGRTLLPCFSPFRLIFRISVLFILLEAHPVPVSFRFDFSALFFPCFTRKNVNRPVHTLLMYRQNDSVLQQSQ